MLRVVMDNFSRCILSWKVSLTLSAQLRLETIKDALHKTVNPGDIQLLVDGGCENNNIAIETFLKDTPIRKIIAQKDIQLSNSMIEAMNKIVKHSYLAGKTFYSLDSLEQCLVAAIYDYTIVRPHISLKGLTPSEAHCGITAPLTTFSSILSEARVERLISNKRNRCYECM